MARFILLALSTSLALFSTQAHAKHKSEGLRVYAFASDDCNGPTIGGNRDLKRDQCFDLVGGGAQSIRPMEPHGSSKWINDKTIDQCAMISFKQFGCRDVEAFARADLPGDLRGCVASKDGSQALSVLFTCNKKKIKTCGGYIGLDPVETVIVAGPEPVTVTQTVGHEAEPVQTVIVYSPPEKRLAARSDRDSSQELDDGEQDDTEPDCEGEECPDPTTDLQTRNKGKWKGPRKGVWMRHPWASSLMCYECYTKSAKNTEKFECRSGPKNAVSCGEMPIPDTTITTTIYPTQTVAVVAGQPNAQLEKRSWHKNVVFPHPWFPGTTVCADAEWEKRGQKKTEIRLQHPKSNKKHCNNPEDIGVEQCIMTAIGPTQTVYVTLAPPRFTTITVTPPGPSTLTVDPDTSTVFVPAPQTPTVTVIASTLCSEIVVEKPAPVKTTVLVAPQPGSTTTVTVGKPPPSFITVTQSYYPPVVATTTTVVVQPQPAPSYITVGPLPLDPHYLYTTLQQRKEHTDL